MKQTRSFVFALFLIVSVLLAACGGAAPAASAPQSAASDSAQVEFAGTVESINGDQWTVGGRTFKVTDSAGTAKDVKVGDYVKVSATVNADGSVVAGNVAVSSPEAAQAQAQEQAQTQTQAQSQTQTQTQGIKPSAPAAGSASSGTAQNEQEFVGAVESITGDTWVIGGETFTVTNFTEFKNVIAAGDLVKVHVIFNADGTVSIVEIELALPGSTTGWQDNSNTNSNSNGNSNDDNSNGNSNDDNGYGDNGNSNDDNSNGNSNDDNGNDDNSNGDDSNDNGDDDNGNGDDDNSNDGNDNGSNTNG